MTEERKKIGQLVLSRKPGESIIINNDITITVIEIDRGKVRLGIAAPRNVPILRSEIIKEYPNAAGSQKAIPAVQRPDDDEPSEPDPDLQAS